MNLQEITPETLKIINKTPFLLSILYDVNLLPEQVTTYQQANLMAAIVESYLVGYEDGYDQGLNDGYLSGRAE